MKKFFIIVICIAIAAMVGYGIKYAVTPINTQKLSYITQENAINTNGFIIRDEWVMYSRSAGTAYHSVAEGERVSKDSTIGSLFYGDVSDDSIKELTVVDNKIKKTKTEKSEESISTLDSNTLENNIYERENDIIDAAQDNDILSIAKYKKDINSLRQSNQLAEDNTEQKLENQREQILNSIGVNKEDIYAQISGVFTTYVDGYETELVPNDIENYDVSYFEGLSQSPKIQKIDNKINAGGAVCKIVNNHVWYVMMDIPSDTIEGREVGDNVKLRFNNMADAVVKGSINSVSAEENGRVILTVKCPTYLESAFSYRLVDVDLIFESYEGYKVPIQSVRTEDDGSKKVIGIKENREHDCYCDVLFTNTDAGYAIIESTDNAENKLSQMERIVVGER